MRSSRFRYERAHPRSRGENQTGAHRRCPRGGSSPLTRGKRSVQFTEGSATGLIPAHAGKTKPTARTTRGRGAHPRSRGENAGSRRCGQRPQGSSPLTRGKPSSSSARVSAIGLIPAHAGKTNKVILEGVVGRAHPRSRGENLLTPDKDEMIPGSSPLTRGKLGRWGLPLLSGRLIPAHAGKTLPDLRFYRADRSDLGKP